MNLLSKFQTPKHQKGRDLLQKKIQNSGSALVNKVVPPPTLINDEIVTINFAFFKWPIEAPRLERWRNPII